MNIHMTATALKSEIERLLSSFPELAEDDDFRADVLEGETDFFAVIERLLRREREAASMVTAIKERQADLKDRRDRFERQSDVCRKIIKELMITAQLPKVQLAEATIVITSPRVKVSVFNAEALPQGFFAVERKPKTAEIKSALEAGDQIPGAELVFGDEGLTVRAK